MSARLIDGKAIAAALRQRIKIAAATLPRPPALAVVLAGDDPASQVYVRSKARQTREAGMVSAEHRLGADTSQQALAALVQNLNADEAIDGILVQLPLPGHLDEAAIIEQIDPAKDVDGLTEVNAGRLVLNRPGLRPCTPAGCVILARETLGELSGKTCVIVGRSILVGKPAAFLFLQENCTVTIAHSRSRDLAALCRTADILVAAVGRAQMLGGDFIKPGACIIDVGINRVDDPEAKRGYRLTGDVDFAAASQLAGAITPVPGGVGPMTIACLLHNTVLAACARHDWPVPEGL